MNVLLDTHAFLWFESADSRLSKTAKEAIQNPENIKYISIASFWEIVIKNSIGKLHMDSTFEMLFSLSGYHHLEISFSHLEKLRHLQFFHRDPFDRLVISQGLTEKMPIVSIDDNFDKYNVERIW